MSGDQDYAARIHWKIYVLLDPRTTPPTARYVGCTSGSVDTRVSLHISSAYHAHDSDLPKIVWLRDLLKDEVEPQYLVVERLPKSADWEAAEQRWIAHYGRDVLTNMSAGGAGASLSRSETTKRRIGDFFRGRELTEDHKAKLSAAKLGHAVSEETREKLRQANLGKKHTEETKAKHRARMQSFTHTDEARRKISETRKQRFANGDLTVSLSAASRAKLSASVSSLVWINDGATNRRVPRGDAIPEGWQAGRALTDKQRDMYQSHRKAQP